MEHLPDDNSRYKDIDYWDERYKTEQCFDWLGSFSKFQHLLEKHVHKEDSILILGSLFYLISIVRDTKPLSAHIVTIWGDNTFDSRFKSTLSVPHKFVTCQLPSSWLWMLSLASHILMLNPSSYCCWSRVFVWGCLMLLLCGLSIGSHNRWHENTRNL